MKLIIIVALLIMNCFTVYTQTVISQEEVNNILKEHYELESCKCQVTYYIDIVDSLEYNILDYKTLLNNKDKSIQYKDSISINNNKKYLKCSEYLDIKDKEIKSIKKKSFYKTIGLGILGVLLVIAIL